MTKVKSLYHRFAVGITAILGLVAFICANTTSCCMIYQPEAPRGMDKYRKFK